MKVTIRVRSRYFYPIALFWMLLWVFVAVACSPSDPNDPNSPNNPNNPNSPINQSITPLPETSFLYVQYDAKGNGQIYAYDTTSGQSTLIHKLLSYGDIGTNAPTIALSPDRKWIAMTGLFRPTQKEMEQGKAVKSLWRISVDGKQTVRVSDPLLLVKGKTCTTDVECSATGEVCNTALKQCTKRNYTLGLGSPEWSNDGKTIYVTFSQHWNGASGRLEGGATPASVPAGGGTLTLHTPTLGCQQLTHPSFHPKKNSLILYHSVCSSDREGFHEYDASLKDKGKQLIVSNQLSQIMGKVAWKSDGSGFFFLANSSWDLNNDGKPDGQGIGVVFYQIDGGKMQGVMPPLNPGLSYGQMSLSPKGDQLAFCVSNVQAGTSDLYIAPISSGTGQIKQLTKDGKSCQPVWK